MMRVGVRELRENLKKYLARVKSGDRLEVTQRGIPVAQLVPVEYEEEDAIARLQARGLIARRARGGIDDLPAPLEPAPGRSISDILDEQRQERI
jgi:prevent-host-death family protein